VTDGDLFDEKTKVKMVFIDGRKYEVREPGRPTAPPAVSLTGTWTLTVDTRQGPQERTAELMMAEDGSLTGTITAPMGTQSLSSGWVSGNKFSFTVTFTMRGRPTDATYSGTVEGNRMTGTVSVGRATTEFTGIRPDKSSGDTTGREGDE